MGVIIAVTIEPNGAGFVVIPERYPLQGARSSRLTVARTRNPATGRPCTKRLTWARGYPRQRFHLVIVWRCRSVTSGLAGWLVVRRARIRAAAAAVASATAMMAAI